MALDDRPAPVDPVLDRIRAGQARGTAARTKTRSPSHVPEAPAQLTTHTVARRLMSDVPRDLVYDLGSHDGADTAYYLELGHRVVAVEASPEMIHRGEERFADEIRSRRLTLVHGAVAATDAPAEITLHVSAQSEWTSLDPALAGRDGVETVPVVVPTVTIAALLEGHGTPYYLKIDIEGTDAVVLEELARTPFRPTYVSVEAESTGESGSTEDDAIQQLERLAALGYRRFKLVDQDSLRVLSPTNVALGPKRGLRRWFRKKLRSGGERRHVVRVRGRRTVFPFGSSGPFGEDLAGSWLDVDAARELLISSRRTYFSRRDARPYGFWCDWHAAR